MKYIDVVRWTGALVDCIGFAVVAYLLFYAALSL